MLLDGFGKSSFVHADLGTVGRGNCDIGAVDVLMIADQFDDDLVKSSCHIVCIED